MNYVSTRHGSAPGAAGSPSLGFEDVMLAGLARDGGLYLPAEWPRFSTAEIAAMKGKPYVEVAYRVMKPFVGNAFDEPTFRRLIAEAYASIDVAEWSRDPDTLVVQDAGEILYRLRDASAGAA